MLLQKFFKKPSVLKRWDTRKECRICFFEKMMTADFQNMIETFESYSIIHKCFINNAFIEHIGINIENNTHYENCTIEITTLHSVGAFLSLYSFSNCVFYIPDIEENQAFFNLKADVMNKILENNTIVKSSYIEHIAKKYNGNLNKARYSEISGISLDYSDLRNVTLPKRDRFFQALSTSMIVGTKLPKIDFNNYILLGVSFHEVEFDENSIVSNGFLTNSVYSCKLPKIDFNQLTKPQDKSSPDTTNRYEPSYCIRDCVFHEDTIFPNDKEFFTKHSITGSTLPPWDYSVYDINNYSFNLCIFHEEAILPDSLFMTNNSSIANRIKQLPTRHLSDFIMFSKIHNPEKFISKYIDNLSPEDIFIIEQRYPLHKVVTQ